MSTINQVVKDLEVKFKKRVCYIVDSPQIELFKKYCSDGLIIRFNLNISLGRS